jgi:hypothetical protein
MPDFGITVLPDPISVGGRVRNSTLIFPAHRFPETVPGVSLTEPSMT